MLRGLPGLHEIVRGSQLDWLGRVPDLVAADPDFYSATGEATAEAVGVKRVSVAHHRHEERPPQAGAEAAQVQEGAALGGRGAKGASAC